MVLVNTDLVRSQPDRTKGSRKNCEGRICATVLSKGNICIQQATLERCLLDVIRSGDDAQAKSDVAQQFHARCLAMLLSRSPATATRHTLAPLYVSPASRYVPDIVPIGLCAAPARRQRTKLILQNPSIPQLVPCQDSVQTDLSNYRQNAS